MTNLPSLVFKQRLNFVDGVNQRQRRQHSPVNDVVKCVRIRPTLWDQKNPLYYKKSLKPRLWEQIGKKIDMPPLECKHKMNILMSSFRREKAKIMHKMGDNNGDSPNYVVSWFAFKELMFLMDKDNERERQRMKGQHSENLDDEIEDNNGSSSSLKRTLLKHHIQAPNSSEKRPCFSVSTNTSPTPQPPPIANTSDTDDEIKSFANFISSKMKKYSETTKNMVQQAICEIIFKADQNFYENNEKFVIVDENDPFANNIDEDNTSGDIKAEYDMQCFIDENSK